MKKKFYLIIIIMLFSFWWPHSGSADTVHVTAARVNIRTGPGADYRVIGQAKKNDVLERIQRKNWGWALVKLPSGKTGWIYEKYLAADTLKQQPTLGTVEKQKQIEMARGAETDKLKDQLAEQQKMLKQILDKLNDIKENLAVKAASNQQEQIREYLREIEMASEAEINKLKDQLAEQQKMLDKALDELNILIKTQSERITNAQLEQQQKMLDKALDELNILIKTQSERITNAQLERIREYIKRQGTPR